MGWQGLAIGSRIDPSPDRYLPLSDPRPRRPPLKQISVRLPQELLLRVDQEAAARYQTRNEWILQLITDRLASR